MIGLTVTIWDWSKYHGRRAKVKREWLERYDNGSIVHMGYVVEVDGEDWGLEFGQWKF